MKRLIVILSLSLSYSTAYATPQIGDLLIYKGDTIRVYPFLLDSFLHNHNTFFEENKSIRLSSTACWRGYQSVFEVRNDSLFLQKIFGAGKQEMDIISVFNKQDNVFLGWYTGTLTNPRNRQIYVHDGWGGYYEYETDFVFEKGILKNVSEYHNTIKPSVYADLRTNVLGDFIKSNINYDNIKPISYRMRISVRIDKVDENGKITDVSVLRGFNEEYDREAVRVVKSIPQWQVIIRRGELIQIPWNIPVLFEARDW